MTDPFDTVTIDEASELIGVSRPQLARWCADGTMKRMGCAFWGSVIRWERLRFDRGWMKQRAQELAEEAA